MKRNIRLWLFLLGLWSAGLAPPLRGQEIVDRLDHLIPPSPQAAALTRAGSVDVSLYTGSASVRIPLWTLKGEVVSVPVYLSFTATA